MIRNLLTAVFISLLIYGCASTSCSKPGVDSSRDSAVQNSDDKDLDAEGADTHEQAKIITTASYDAAPEPIQTRKTTPASREAVLDLLTQSKQAIDVNDYDEAENILKRALRIEPGNAWLWYNMAVVSFYQADYHQAIQQALKSNNLERYAQQLRNNNFKIIEQSYIELDEPAQARSYAKKITR